MTAQIPTLPKLAAASSAKVIWAPEGQKILSTTVPR
jgi:hypothetical protein